MVLKKNVENMRILEIRYDNGKKIVSSETSL